MLDSLYDPAHTSLIEQFYVPVDTLAKPLPTGRGGIETYFGVPKSASDAVLAALNHLSGQEPARSLRNQLREWRRVEWIDSSAVVVQEGRGSKRRYLIRHAAMLSQAGIAPAGDEALVRVLTLCGGLCGGEYVVYLRRESPGGWRVREVGVLRVS